MEKIPDLRIVGDASEEAKAKERQTIEARLTDHVASLSETEQKALERLEYPKSPEELSLIDFANEESNRLRAEAGVESYDIPYANYHIIPPESYKKIDPEGNSSATSRVTEQGMVFRADYFRGNLVYFGSVAFHETLHLKSHVTFEVSEKDKKIKSTIYRQGVTVRATQKKGLNSEYHSHFDGLHEAIVSAQEKISLSNMMQLPVLQTERERLSSEEAVKLKKIISEKKDIPLDDIIWVGEKENEYETISYSRQRAVLRYVCEEIQKDFSDQYQTPEDVYKEFLKAQFTGQILPIARLVEGAFGEGSFRLLSNMKTDKESGVLTLEALKKERIRAKK